MKTRVNWENVYLLGAASVFVEIVLIAQTYFALLAEVTLPPLP